MAELNTKENETKEVVKEITAKPIVLSGDQVDFFTDLIKDNSPYLQEEILSCLLYTSDAADE